MGGIERDCGLPLFSKGYIIQEATTLLLHLFSFFVKVYHLRKFFSVPGVVDEALSLFSSLPFCVVVPNTSLFFIDGLMLDTKHLYDKLINVLMTRLSAVRKLKYIDGSVRTKI